MIYKYNGKVFRGILLGDHELEIFMNDKHLCYINLNKYKSKSFEDIVKYLCKNNYENLYDEIYFNERCEEKYGKTI